MDDTPDQTALPDLYNRLNNFDHRLNAPSRIEDPEDLLTEVTPAQRERLIYMVDDALDTLEGNLTAGTAEIKQRAAENVLDRAGLTKRTKDLTPQSAADIPAEALLSVIQGLATMFGAKQPAMKHAMPSGPPQQQHMAIEEATAEADIVQKPKSMIPKALMDRYKDGK